MSAWLWLAAAIGFEIAATLALRSSHGFTVPWAVAALAVGYVASFFCLSVALRRIPLSSAYAIWSAAGTTIVTLVGIVAFGEPRTALKLASVALVVVGIVGLRLS